MIKITVLNDNRLCDNSCESEHGLSLYLEINGHKILMDVGQSEIFKRNAEKLGINLNDIAKIVLSHGHYDHGKGLHYANKGVELICHPDSCMYRYSTRTEQYGGIGYTKEELEQDFKLVMTKEPYKIYDDIYFLGEIPRKFDFEGKETPMTLEDGSGDLVPDDSSIAINTKDGLIVISGCAHSGICNTIEYAKEVTGQDRVYAVIGGFHLKELNDNTESTIQYFRGSGVNKVILAHCTSDKVCEEFKSRLSDKMQVDVLGTGKSYEFDLETESELSND